MTRIGDLRMVNKGLVGLGPDNTLEDHIEDENITDVHMHDYFSYLSSNTSAVNNSTTLVDSGLTVTLTAAGTYFVDFTPIWTTAAAADIKWQLTGTATVTSGLLMDHHWGTAKYTAWETNIALVSDSPTSDLANPFSGYLVVSVAGTVKVQFGQNTADVSYTTMRSGSYLLLRRMV